LTEDQDLFVREGDIIFYGLNFYEIMSLAEPRPLFGQVEHKFEIKATCNRVRDGFFNEPIAALQIREKYRQTQENIIDIIQNTTVEGACEGKIQLISGKRTSSQRSQFLDYVNNPQKYEGCVVYLTEIDEDEIYGDFDQPDKFYFNEEGAWYVSQFFAL
jgi:hypothetical protein